MVLSMEPGFLLFMTVLHNSALALWRFCHVVREAEDFRKQILPYSVKITVNLPLLEKFYPHLLSILHSLTEIAPGVKLFVNTFFHCHQEKFCHVLIIIFSTWVKRVWKISWSYSVHSKKTKKISWQPIGWLNCFTHCHFEE